MNLDKTMYDYDTSPRNKMYIDSTNKECARKLDFDHVVMNPSTLYVHCKDANDWNTLHPYQKVAALQNILEEAKKYPNYQNVELMFNIIVDLDKKRVEYMKESK